MNKKGVGYLMWVLILLVLTVGLAVQNSESFDVKEFKDKIQWQEVNITVEESPELAGALNDAINGIGSAFFGIARWASDLANENPTIPFKLIIFFVILAIAAPVILVAIKIGAIIFILTKEFIQSKKEKQLLKNAKNKN